MVSNNGHSPNPELERQIDVVMRLLDGKQLSRSSPIFEKALGWIVNFPAALPEEKKDKLLKMVCSSFTISPAEIYGALSGVDVGKLVREKQEAPVAGEKELYEALPRGGWFEWWAEYTKYTESPLSFHIFASLCTLGCSLGRRVWVDMGFFNIYPNYCCVFVGPTGKVRKTSAVDIAKRFIKEAALCPIMADKVTPEALATALLENGGQQFIYAPEFSILFGKQKYNQGLVTTIIRLLDCPNEFEVRTLTRGVETVTNIALTVLGASTLSLLTSASPEEVTSSGFLNRFLLVVENDSARCFPVPSRGDPVLEQKLLSTLARMKTYEGEMIFSPLAKMWYSDWYSRKREQLRRVSDEITAEVLERIPTHFVRTAMLMHAAQCGNSEICDGCLQAAARLIEYVEQRVPQMVHELNATALSQDAAYVLETIRRLGGAVDHSTLLRRVSSRMDAALLKRHVRTMEEANLLKYEKKGMVQYYILKGNQDAHSS